MKRLHDAIDEYLALRRALGFKLRHHTWWLPDFLEFLRAQGSSVITTELALRWAQQPAATTPGWRARRLAAIRDFARHHHASDERTEIPPPGLIPFRKRRLTPHLYTEAEVAALLDQSRRLARPLLAAGYTTLFGLLVATGMRIGEVIALDRRDVDWKHALITIRLAKFGKSRLVPLHPSTLAALHDYSLLRDRLQPHPRCPSFFLSTTGTRLIYQNLHLAFLRLVRLANISARGHRPRIHDLRHTFAMKTLRAWYRDGIDVESHLPRLSTYLGHVNPTTTYWYLTATPELLTLAGKRLERAWGAHS